MLWPMGTGALMFLKTLLAVYLREQGEPIPYLQDGPDVNTSPKAEEWEDAYPKYANSKVKSKLHHSRAYHQTGTEEPFLYIKCNYGFASVDKLKQVCKGYQVSVTEYWQRR